MPANKHSRQIKMSLAEIAKIAKRIEFSGIFEFLSALGVLSVLGERMF